MNAISSDAGLAEPHLAEVLAAVGLDVEYVRAEGNTLYRLDEQQREAPVLDFVGGFGSLILGHNHPEIVTYAQDLLRSQLPIHAQFSRAAHADRLASALNSVLRRELGDDERYFAIFANSGAEAVEAAVKHAEFDRSLKLAALSEQIDAHVTQARSLVQGGLAVPADSAYARLDEAGPSGDPVQDLEELIAHVERWNAERLSTPPLFLAPEGAFHGKLVGSVQLTHNEAFRTPFKALAAQARFVPLDQPEAIRKTIDAERRVLLDLAVTDGAVTVVEREFPVFCAFVLEPIQGEGGINMVTREFAEAVRSACDAIGCPVVVDEIQSGMGRSGAFLASSLIGLRGDYYTLAKSLGGGVAKTSVVLIRESRYRREFELVHSSTFAKDGFSSLVALKVLELLEADGGRLYRVVAERGRSLRTMLETVRADFPDVLKDVRGAGLMLGVEFQDQSGSTAGAVRDFARSGFLGYAVAGYLLRRHAVRLFPTGSAANTLRLEPSVALTDDEISQLEAALRDVCSVLRDQDEGRFVGA
ncbi:diaminobutyrate--pyruvate aminotransferase [Streptomyces spinoverrucosus]|uniref:Diaminobutyrate--pyruvate aminotransferase n=1 Tax=Streptomyces spinoverrucosus TaxID=284043 RepID=A0A4Y3VQX7_9ACTN|nr:aminotransferase class III-fold pyridoxal phosphate-dependent enzyme [Streptomyces spinoverrucosus]GEC08110.1 diaminobutyrate--pyruvate aminotransferase [Streptomyces spinoverrucosus]GHB64742.1 diaminobutyrate--pyruvate aminotransferase [Streptomyces spinoverrucosus]